MANFDWALLIGMLFICALSLGTLYSAGFNPETGASAPMRKQAIAMGLGLVGFLICCFSNLNFWRRMAWPIFIVGCLILVFLDFRGIDAKGARRWLELGSYFRLQPSEFTKIAVILLFARIFAAEDAPKDGYTLRQLFFPIVLFIIPVALIILQPDLGTALCHILIAASMMFIAGIRLRTVFLMVLTALLLAYPAWMKLHDYQRKRIITFVAPESDPLGSGYHAIQSQIAVGSGALLGKGYLKGTQTQLSFLPEQTTDFIFSVLAEEWGFIGSIVALSLYSLVLFRVLGVAARCKERFPAFVAFGVGMMLFWHVFINIGMVIGVMPVVGITLPLLSYGGSSVVAFMSALGLVAGINMRRFVFS